nr:putative integron gene cassette protein [uncultured bacterium]
MTEAITGNCPFCKTGTTFRELSFTELTTSLFSFFGNAITGGIKGKAGAVATLIEDFSDNRTFKNYKCISCNKEVMQCSECQQIIPYSDTGAEHVCGATEANLQSSIPRNPPPIKANDDALSLLERLSSLHKNGLLNDEEFASKKAEILSRI